MNTSTQDLADGDAGAPHIAVIGMAGRFPRAKSVEEFWANIAGGRECISFFSPEEVVEAGVPEAMRSSRDFVPARAIIDDPFHFDAPFFGFSPMEARLCDPQHRLFLECAWEALENAGVDPSRTQEAIGVYAGADANAYALSTMLLGATDMLSLLGSDKDYMATRASFKLDLRGPGVTIQTACSTSLVAVQLACQGLLGYQCDIALAGGVGVAFPQKAGYVYQPGNILSPDGHCRPFDAKAKGTVGGDGLGIVVLKRLGDALRDGDMVHAVIRGAAINNDGAQKMGFTAPSVQGQAEVITMALEMADVDPSTITYVECHGTATELGDPVEISALTDAYRAYTDKKGYCAIGSVKSNVGHMNSAAGVGGLIKTIMALKHRQIPKSLHFESPNPMIDLAGSPFFVSTRLAPWEPRDTPRRAGVSSFGVGGTNAHVILEEAPPPPPSGPSRSHHLLVVSAKSDAALAAATENLVKHLEQHPEVPLGDAAYTLLVGRQLFKHRRMAVCRTAAEARATMLDAEAVHRETRRAPVVFLFPGQGAQQVNMARSIYETEPVFREEVDACAEILQPILGLDLRRILFPAPERAEEATAELRETRLAQPALFVIEYALARLWMSLGVKPEAMIGHSIGEYVAACIAGVMPKDAALRIVAARGALVQEQPTGAMLATGLTEEEAASRFPSVAVAALNAPGLTVLSGPAAAIDAVERELREHKVEHTRLHTSHAFHSPMIAPAVAELRAVVAKHSLSAPSIPYLSNVTGTWITPAEATDPAYWARHLRQTVRFSDGIAELLADPDRILLEVGPGRNLTALVARHGPKARERAVPSLAHARAEGEDLPSFLEALGRLYLADAPIDWRAFYAGEQRLRVPLPTYPFERHPYARELNQPLLEAAQPSAKGGKRPDVGDWLYVPSWKRSAGLPPPREAGGPWLIFTDGSRLAVAIIERLERAGAKVVTASAGTSFRSISSARYEIDPAAPGDYKTLLAEIEAAGVSPRRILHLFSLPAAISAPGGHDASMRAGFYSLLFLGQALAGKGGDPRRIGVVTSEVRSVLGDERIDPGKATLLALGRGLGQELPQVATSVIDLPVAAAESDDPRLVDRILAELAGEGDERVVALRGGHLWVAGFEPVPRTTPSRVALRERGVYLIVGGLGRIGLAIAEHLARAVRARLVLTGRSGLIAKEEWDAWQSSHRDDDRMSRRIRKIREIEALGAEVLVRSADVADERQMAHVVEQARLRFGEIHGVIHAAGVVGAEALRALVDTTPAHCEAHFRPKIAGLQVLERVLPRGLDLHLLCSSLATALGGVGFTAYAAAGHFMDAFAEEQTRRGDGRWISVDWDAWAPPEDNHQGAGGLAALAIRSEEGALALDAILALEGAAQVVVSTTDLTARREQIRRLLLAAEKAPAAGDRGPKITHARPALDTPYLAPRSELEATLADLWQEVLGIDRIGVNDNFFKLGGDSLMAIQLGTRLRETRGIEIPINELFGEPTIAGLASRIEALGAPGKAGHDTVESTLSMVENLSDEEVKRMLAELSK